MKILVACEESQRVCNAFRKKGHEAWSCDIIPTSGDHPEWHIQGDVIEQLNNKWDMIIAFPPCTYFTTAGACRMYQKDECGISHLNLDRYKKMLKMRDLFYAIYNAQCDKIVIENPTPMKIAELPPHSQVIQPWQYGEPWTKRTLLWVKGVPLLKPTDIVEPIMGSWVSSGSDYRRKGKGNVFGKSSAKDRSKTFQGVADAMAEQWG